MTKNDDKISIRDLARIDVQPDEILLVIVPDNYTPTQMRVMADSVRATLPGVRILFGTDRVKFATIKIHEADEFSTHRSPEISLSDMEKHWS